MMIRKRGGQTIVELLLVLPVLMMMIFVILELGNIAYHMLIAHHACYEMARVGSMVGVRKPSGSADSSTVSNKMKEVLQTLFGGTRAEQMQFKVQLQSTGNDPQYDRHVNEDVIVSLIYRINLLFPLTSYIFADKPKKLGIKRITVTVRMPVEKPLLN